jgi:hypothetical protein
MRQIFLLLTYGLHARRQLERQPALGPGPARTGVFSRRMPRRASLTLL